jgi:hypothetical protein
VQFTALTTRKTCNGISLDIMVLSREGVLVPPIGTEAVMSNKQFFAQVGIFTLLSLNVAAYYIFWPTSNRWPMSEANASGLEKTRLNFGDEKKEGPLDPPSGVTPFPALPEIPQSQLDRLNDDASDQALRDIRPFQQVSGTNSTSLQDDENAVKKELEADKSNRKSVRSANSELPELPALPISPNDPEKTVKQEREGGDKAVAQQLEKLTQQEAPQRISAAMANPPVIQEPPIDAKYELKVRQQVAATNGLVSKMQSPWLLQMEVVGAQTQLMAQLQQKSTGRLLASFKILCDRVDMKAPDGALQAIGKVTFVGAGVKGSCRRLTLPLSDVRIIFEEDVVIRHEPPTGIVPTEEEKNCVLRGEKILWEMPLVETKTNEVSAASLPLPPASGQPSGLGLPPASGQPNGLAASGQQSGLLPLPPASGQPSGLPTPPASVPLPPPGLPVPSPFLPTGQEAPR